MIYYSDEQLKFLSKGTWKIQPLLDQMKESVKEIDRICPDSKRILKELENEIKQFEQRELEREIWKKENSRTES